MKRNYYIRNIPPEEIRREISECEREIWNVRMAVLEIGRYR